MSLQSYSNDLAKPEKAISTIDAYAYHIIGCVCVQRYIFVQLIVLFLLFETGSLYIALVVLELTRKTRLASNSQEIRLPLLAQCWLRCKAPNPGRTFISKVLND